MADFAEVRGEIVGIEEFYTDNEEEAGCNKIYSVEDGRGDIVNFFISPGTYFVDQAMIQIGDYVIGFYDSSLPTLLIYPPRYNAIVMAVDSRFRNVTVDTFNRQLINKSGTLKLNIGPDTLITLTNGQAFTGNLENRNLIVIFTATTRSIPAQTTPEQIIVLCSHTS